MSSSAAQVQQFYNARFFDGQKPIHAQVVITITDADGNSITLPMANIHPGHKLGDIVVAAHNFLRSPEAVPTQISESGEADARSEVINMERIEMKSGVYFVEELKDGSFVIQNQNRELVSLNTMLGKGILKKYRQQTGQED